MQWLVTLPQEDESKLWQEMASIITWVTVSIT